MNNEEETKRASQVYPQGSPRLIGEPISRDLDDTTWHFTTRTVAGGGGEKLSEFPPCAWIPQSPSAYDSWTPRFRDSRLAGPSERRRLAAHTSRNSV
ncbi:unnamed protein product [Diplocarpon coronariae]|nr:hypothetical protein JHW43_001123 [Diplocarpon mali]